MSGAAPDEEPVEIHTDGACSGNPGPGGWGAILEWKGKRRELSGGEPLTTNNRMELLAAIAALETLARPMPVILFTDSQYLRQGITEWIAGWRARGWRTADQKPVENQSPWERLGMACCHAVQVISSRPHAGRSSSARRANAAVSITVTNPSTSPHAALPHKGPGCGSDAGR